MGRFAMRICVRGSVAILIFSVGILALPQQSIGGGSVSGTTSQAQRIQDPEKMQKALYGLVQKARAQHAQLQNWHRQARLGKAKGETQNGRSVARASELDDAWRKFCKARLAMTDTAVGVSSPVSMRVLDSCSSGTILPLNRK